MLTYSRHLPWLLSLLAVITARNPHGHHGHDHHDHDHHDHDHHGHDHHGHGHAEPRSAHSEDHLPEVPSALDMRLLRQVATDAGRNEAISPYVMSSLMSQVFLGAGGSSSAEIRRALGVEEEHDSAEVPHFLDGYQSANKYLSSENSNATVAVFNRMYVGQGFPVRPAYSFTLREAFGSDVRTIYSPEQAAADINQDVAKVTRNKIQDLVSTDTLRDAALVLVSALYFKALWKHPLDPAGKGSFLTAAGDRQVDMMRLDTTSLLYADMGTFQAAALPYEDPDYCLLLLRPAERSMASVETLLNTVGTLNLTEVEHSMFLRDLIVTMPKFKIESEYSLPDHLKALGVREIFQSGAADLSGMTEHPQVYVSDVIHKVFLEVTEEGTEAAGAGAVVIVPISLPPPPVRFVLDRPFVAVVFNKRHNLNLFAAYVASPSF